jgi:biotin synthase
MLKSLTERVLNGASLSREDALGIASVDGAEVFELFSSANKIREAYRGKKIDLCSIVSAKTGACPEDCSYCAQSKVARAEIKTHPLVDRGYVLEKARTAKGQGAKRFCVVISGKRATDSELKQIASMVSAIRSAGLLPCATLGLLKPDELRMLKDAGLYRYHHNLETSRRFFPQICRTHSYEDKIKTIEAVKASGLSLCSGGIFGMGEDWQDRIDMALTLRELEADSIPINFLVPIKGTPLEDIKPLRPLEALKIISLYRFLLPDKEIRVCGGRLQILGEFNSFVFMAGADGLLTGDCLTTSGRKPKDDLKLIEQYGLSLS